jgi:AbrB family looped-hinge helix DNA binding protein
MPIAQSKLTAQGQISVPVEVRKKLGLRPGSVLEWDEKGGEVVVRSAGRYTSAQVHEVLFGASHTQRAKVDVKEGIRKHIRQRHARD